MEVGTLPSTVLESHTKLTTEEAFAKLTTNYYFQVVFDSYPAGEPIEVDIKGYSVVGSGYTGDLMCTGLTHWRVALLTSRFIGSRSRFFTGKKVLELGCGLGLCGIVAAHAVGSNGRVLLTDRDSEALSIATSNVRRNNVEQIAQSALLEWNDEAAFHRIRNNFSAMDGGSAVGFDIIVGSDCLYSGMEAVKQLFGVVAAMLANDEITSDYLQLQPMPQDCALNTDRTTLGASHHEDGSDALLQPTSTDGGGWMSVPLPHVDRPVVHSKPVFILGYERRLGGSDVDMCAMFEIAANLGLDWCIAEDSVIDIFGNETSEQTLLWEQCVMLFTRRSSSKSDY